MLEPPDLDHPLTEQDRAVTLARFLGTCVGLEYWLRLADGDHVPSDVRDAMSTRMQGGDSPELMLTRWQNLFEEELRAVFHSRNRLVHGVRLTDKELRGADWLANQLLRLIDPGLAA